MAISRAGLLGGGGFTAASCSRVSRWWGALVKLGTDRGGYRPAAAAGEPAGCADLTISDMNWELNCPLNLFISAAAIWSLVIELLEAGAAVVCVE